jgi:hypothetical protein
MCEQESAELLREEGKLLESVQGNTVRDYDIDEYTVRLEGVSAWERVGRQASQHRVHLHACGHCACEIVWAHGFCVAA